MNNANPDLKWQKTSGGFRASARGGFWSIYKSNGSWVLRFVNAEGTGIEIPCKSLKAAKAAAL